MVNTMTTCVPAEAQEAVGQIIDYLCQEIVFGRLKQEEWWETVEFFQQGMPKSSYAALGQIRIIDVENMETENWLELVELMIPFESKFSTDIEFGKVYSKMMRLLRLQLILSHYRGKERLDKSNMNSALKAMESDVVAYNRIKGTIEMDKTKRSFAMDEKPLSLDYFHAKVMAEHLPKLMMSLGFVPRPDCLSTNNAPLSRDLVKKYNRNQSKLDSNQDDGSAVEIDDNSTHPELTEYNTNNVLPANAADNYPEINAVDNYPELNAADKEQSDKENTQEALKRLEIARHQLREGVDDPFQEIRKIAQKARKRQYNSAALYEKKKSARALIFDEGNTSEAEGPKLSAIPNKMKLPPPMPLVTDTDFVSARPPGTRLPWTNDEKTAVKQGILKYGVGKWGQIKSEYAEILRHRTAVNIKDCFRTMQKRGEFVIMEE